MIKCIFFNAFLVLWAIKGSMGNELTMLIKPATSRSIGMSGNVTNFNNINIR